MAAVVAITLAACGTADNEQADQVAPSPAETTAETTTSPTAQEQASHNQADVEFAQHMIPHHEQAIEMSDIVLAKEGIDPRVVEMATQIKDAQGPEIETMEGWLQEWGEPTMAPHGDMPAHGDMPMMEGMLSAAEIDDLRNAEGVEASRLFLTGMIRHHEGAITMAQDQIDNGQYPPAVEMSRQIIESQQREIDSMNEILASL
ncbi:DUF305 domain-containing protein [Mycolicibacterium thermoresistibile]